MTSSIMDHGNIDYEDIDYENIDYIDFLNQNLKTLITLLILQLERFRHRFWSFNIFFVIIDGKNLKR
jgi:hypothetical protein